MSIDRSRFLKPLDMPSLVAGVLLVFLTWSVSLLLTWYSYRLSPTAGLAPQKLRVFGCFEVRPTREKFCTVGMIEVEPLE